VAKNKHKADILLLDAPCSSLGTLRRKPDLKWKMSPEKLTEINTIQKNILDNYQSMLKPGGDLIYVTCSIIPEENQEIVKDFLNKHKNYTFVTDKTIMPSTSIGDGFYMAKLKKQTL
jgi:16S rRNA (cytosine967-C5)-methyltransferase